MNCAIFLWSSNTAELYKKLINTDYHISYLCYGWKDLIRPYYRAFRYKDRQGLILQREFRKEKIKRVNSKQIKKLYDSGSIAKVIVCYDESEFVQNKQYSIAKKLGVREQDIMFAPIEMFIENENHENLVQYNERNELSYLEYHLVDHCNLNCAYCTMFSALVGEKYADVEETRQGLMNLKRYITHIKKIRLMGGEPLLSPHLEDFINMTREIYPLSDIRIVTNGILIPQLSESAVKAIVDNNIIIDISAYPPLREHVSKMRAFLDGHNIKYQVLEVADYFRKFYSISGGQKREADGQRNYDLCKWKNKCINLKGNSLAPCFVPFVMPYLSDTFKLNIESDGILDLSQEELSATVIQRFLDSNPLDLCKYCAVVENEYTEWRAVKKSEQPRLEDWSI